MRGQERFLEPGTMLAGRYRLESAGVVQDVGAVHEAYDTVQERQVTVLVLPPGLLPSSEALRRLIDLQVIVDGLSQPGLVPYEHTGILAGRPYLVRPTLPHRSLAQILAGGTPLEMGTALEIGLRLCETLTPLHSAGLVHGSLSPYSVLAGKEPSPGARAPEWTVSIVDIGLLPALYGREVPGRRAWGRSPYFSPEQAAGADAHAPSDVYVVASLLYAMLAGRPPFRGSDPALVALQHERQEPPSLKILVPGIPSRLAEVVERGLEKEPADRYENAAQMAHVLRGRRAAMLPVRSAPTQPGSREQLVVPAPPAHFDEIVPPVRQTILVQEQEKEPAMANCLTVLLLILALVAVLGLIPLWRTLYHRYATPPALPTPYPEGWLEPEHLLTSHDLNAASGGPHGRSCWPDPSLECRRGDLPRKRSAPLPLPVLLARWRSVPPEARNWSPGPFSDIMRCCPKVCRANWSQDYGFFRQLGLL